MPPREAIARRRFRGLYSVASARWSAIRSVKECDAGVELGAQRALLQCKVLLAGVGINFGEDGIEVLGDVGGLEAARLRAIFNAAPRGIPLRINFNARRRGRPSDLDA